MVVFYSGEIRAENDNQMVYFYTIKHVLTSQYPKNKVKDEVFFFFKKKKWGEAQKHFLYESKLLFSHGPNSLESWFLGKELLLSIDRHVVTKNKLRISFIYLLVFFLHKLWCRTYGGLE